MVEDELIAALEAGEIASAAIDVVRANPSPPAQLAQLVQASDLLRFPCASLCGLVGQVDEEPLDEASPLWGMENVVITSHTGGETSLYEERLVDILVENFGRWERGEDFVHRIC